MSAVRRTSVFVVGGLAVSALVWIPIAAPAHAEPVTPTYATADLATGASPYSVAVGDLDGDGDRDLVTADSSADTVTVLTRGVGGGYIPTATVSTVVAGAGAGAGLGPASVAIGDLDDDGDQDLATANVDGSVTVLTRDPGGAYTASTASLTGAGSYSVAIGDLDGDGDQDLVTANRDTDSVSLLTRDPGGTFTRTDVGVGAPGSEPLSVAIGDLDGDGDQDLATANSRSDQVSVLTRGPGGAYTATVYPAGDYPVSVAIGDLDRDGDQDLATANAFSDDVTVLTRGAGGAYSSAAPVATGSFPYSVAIGDSDGDGRQELITADAGSDDVTILTRGSGGTYTRAIAGTTGTSPISVAIADLDRDGDQDLVTANIGSDDVTVLTNTAGHRPPNYYASTTAGTTGDGPYSAAIRDLDRDGDQDIATANSSSNNVTVLTRGPAGTYTSTVAGTTASLPFSLAIADLDGDGDQDLATTNADSNNVTILTRGADGTYTSTIAGTTGGGPYSLAIGDLDGDGDQDLATANYASNNVTILTRGADGTYTSTIAGTTGGGPYSLAIGDLDGDGDQDLTTANYTSNNVTILTRGAAGTYTPTVAGTTGASPVSLAIGDLDGDGDQDLATANLGSNNVTVLTRGAAGTYTPTVAGSTGSAPISLAIGDLDGDGDQDLATANLSSNNVTVLTRGAAGTYTSAIAGTTGATPVSVAIGDLDGDGDQDLATANVTSNDVTILTAGRDEATPTTTDNVPTGPRNARVPVTLTANDTGGSGIREIRYAVGTVPGTPTTRYNPASKPTLGNGESIRYFAVDNAGNAETAHTSIAAQVDTTRPTVTLSAPTGPVGGPFTVTATFSETVTGLTASDFVVDNGTASDLTGSGATYTVTITPAADGTVSVDLPAGSAADAATNTTTAATQLTRTADLTRPSVALSAPTGPVSGAFTVTATFSEAVTGLDVSDFSVVNGAANDLTGSGVTYTVTVTPAADGTVSVDLPAGSATDSAANTNTAATQLTRTADLGRPGVSLSAPAGPVDGAFTVTATFSEAVTGLDVSDLSVVNGTASDLTGSGATYTVTVTPTTTGQVTVDLPAGSATDAAGNASTAAVQLTRTVVQPAFSTGPDATVTGTPVVGGTLAAGTGTTVPAAESFTYAWSADGTPIAGATAATLTLDAAHLATTITVTVTATRAGYDDAADTSTATSPVGAGTFDPRPTAAVTGTARVGQTLTATTGAPFPSPDSYAYAWYADDVAVAGQTSPQLTLTSALAGRRISVEVTARRAGYTDAVSRSTATDPVAVDMAPQVALDVSAARTAGQATDGTAAVRRGTRIALTWSATTGTTVTATGELGEILARRYPDGPLPTSGRVTTRLKRLGLHRFRMQAAGPGGTTSAYAAVTVVRAPARLRVEAPAMARSGQRVALLVAGLGGRERYTVTLTRAGSRSPLVSVVTGRANRAGVIRRRIQLPDLGAGEQRVTLRVTGRTTRRSGSTTVRLR